MMRVVHFDDVEVAATEFSPSAMTIVSIGGAPIEGITCPTLKQCEAHVFDGKRIGVTVHVSRDGGEPMAVEYLGTGWYVWDHNRSGQIDTRVAHNSKVVEVWIDGAWKERRGIGAGKERKYYIGDREVTLAPSGWKYVGT
jgi:hypothetical protein